MRQLLVDPDFSKKRFFDRVTIEALAGEGGRGSRALQLLNGKKVPVGGSGGQGGSVIVSASRSVLGLLRYNRKQLTA